MTKRKGGMLAGLDILAAMARAATVPEIKCCDCPFFTKKKVAKGGWCKPPNQERVNITDGFSRAYCCFTYARLVLQGEGYD